MYGVTQFADPTDDTPKRRPVDGSWARVGRSPVKHPDIPTTIAAKATTPIGPPSRGRDGRGTFMPAQLKLSRPGGDGTLRR